MKTGTTLLSLMTATFAAGCALTIPASQLAAQTGKVFDELTLDSKILKGDRKYAIYLPPGYETSQRRYPVLYLLHGSGVDQTGWVQFGEVEPASTGAWPRPIGGWNLRTTPRCPSGSRSARVFVSFSLGSWRLDAVMESLGATHVKRRVRGWLDKKPADVPSGVHDRPEAAADSAQVGTMRC